MPGGDGIVRRGGRQRRPMVSRCPGMSPCRVPSMLDRHTRLVAHRFEARG